MAATDTPANDELWRSYLTGDDDSFVRQRRRYRRLPGKPRCKACLVPLGGAGGRAMRLLKGVEASRKSPNFCNFCDQFARTRPGGAEIELSLLFADVRGSTTIAEGMVPTEFGRLMNRFYEAANAVLIDSDAMIDKLVGDEVIGLYIPAIGPDHPRKAILAARDLLLATGHGELDGPWVPVGAGVHMGTAYVGAVGSRDVADFTALGDAVNVTARLSSAAAAGEILISEAAYGASGLDLGELETRRLELKGRGVPVDVRVLRVGASARVDAAARAAALAE